MSTRELPAPRSRVAPPEQISPSPSGTPPDGHPTSLLDEESAALTGRNGATTWRWVHPSRDGLLVVVGMVLAGGLRAPNLGRAYWVDEGISVGIASHPFSQIPWLLRHDGSPPLFYLLLHVWTSVFGTAEISTHCLSLLLSVLVVPVAYWAGRRLFGRPAALAAVALSATNPFLGWYSTETRMYSLVGLLAIVAVTFTVLAVRGRRGAYAAAASASFVALVYTHNWALYLLAATGGLLVIRGLRQRDRTLLRAVAVCGAAVAAAYTPWMPILISQVQSTAAPWAVSPNLADLFADPSSALGGTLAVVIAPLFAGGIWLTRRHRRDTQGATVTFLAAVGVGTLVIGWIVAQLDPSWTTRYLAVAVGPLLLAVAGALASSRPGRAVIVAACALLAGWSVIGSLLPNPDARYAKSNVAAVAQAAAAYLRPGDVVILTQSEQLAVLDHYLPAGLQYVTPTGPVIDPSVVDWTNIVHRLMVADPCDAVAPTLADLPVGARVLEVSPLIPVGASGSTWSRAAHRQVALVGQLIGTDPSLVGVQHFNEATKPKPFSAVVADLFVKTAGPQSCQ